MRSWFLLFLCSVLFHSPLAAFAGTETEIGTWSIVQGSVLVLKEIDGKKWLLQTTSDRRSYVIRGKNFLTNKNVILTRRVSPSEVANEETELGGMFPAASGDTPQGWPGEWWSSQGYVQNDEGEFIKGVSDESVPEAVEATVNVEKQSESRPVPSAASRSQVPSSRSARAETGSLMTCAGDEFDPQGYLQANKDLKAAGVDPCSHYTTHGKSEGRSPNPYNISNQSKVSLTTCNGDAFDPRGYLETNKDVEAAGVDACSHYTTHGKSEGRNPNPYNLSSQPNVSLSVCNGDAFDPDGYLSVNSDVKAAGVDPCAHYTSHGKREGRSPNPKNIGGGGTSGGGTTGGGTTGGGTSGGGTTGGGTTGGGTTGGGTTGGGTTGGGTTGGGTTGGGSGGDDAKVKISSSDANGTYEYKYFPQAGVPQNAEEGVVKGLMPSHAIIATDSGNMDPNAAIGVEYKLYDSTGKLIVFARDTMGAYHPAFWSDEVKMKTYNQAVWEVWNKWRNNFRAFDPFNSAIDRGNNHRDPFTVYLKPGNYRWEITNIGNTRIHFRADYVGARGDSLFCEYVPKGESRSRSLNIEYSQNTALKLNTNNYGNGNNCGD